MSGPIPIPSLTVASTDRLNSGFSTVDGRQRINFSPKFSGGVPAWVWLAGVAIVGYWVWKEAN